MNPLKRAAFGFARGHVVLRIKTSRPTLYLTFDDGPNARHTLPMLELLARWRVKASFFLVGRYAQAHPEIVTAIVTAGHTLGNHSFSHTKRKGIAPGSVPADIAATDAVLSRFDGRAKHPFRPPWGNVALMQYLRCLLGMEDLVLWSRDSMDYRDQPDSIIENFRRAPPMSGDIILFHDDSPASMQALEVLIPEWKISGFQLDALPSSEK